jgi:hypothetical protein
VSLRITRSPDADPSDPSVALSRSATGAMEGARGGLLELLERLVVSAWVAGRRRLSVEGRVRVVIRSIGLSSRWKNSK